MMKPGMLGYRLWAVCVAFAGAGAWTAVQAQDTNPASPFPSAADMPVPAAPAPVAATPQSPAAPVSAPVPASSEPAVAPTATAPTAEAPAAPEAAGGADVAATPFSHSIFFSQDQLNSIKQARKSYERRISGQPNEDEFKEDEFLKKLENLTTDVPDDQPFTYPQFFLSSILYRSQNDWAIWLNNTKITQDPETQKDGLSVLAIDTQKVTLLWRPTRLDKITDVGKPADSQGVSVDLAKGKVEFTLRGNQTFSSYSMSVLEGRVPQMTTQPKNGAAPAAAPVAQPGAPSPLPVPNRGPARPERTGLSGLIGAYEAIGKQPNR